MWKTQIKMKSGSVIKVNNLQSITRGKEEIKDFKTFKLYNGLLSFVGTSTIASLSSDDIEFVLFQEDKN